MNFRYFRFSVIFIATFSIASIADEPVGIVQSESVNQSSNSVTSYDQTMEARSVSGIEEVVVTAQKREESLQDTPIALTAITESTIEDLDIQNVVDMAGISPNVMLVETPSNNTSATIAMRGGVTINPAITWE
ncbi:MAG: hypothetical protein VW915_06600, partial [Gammaproteobacteria bacterium]